jgi:hypothetical protein
VASVTVTPGSAQAVALGATTSFSATARDASGNPVSGVAFTWTSTATGVATVDGSGVATAEGNGSTSIRASGQGVTGSATLTVSQEPHALSLIGGDAQQGRAREALAEQLQVLVVDSRSNLIPGLAVTWEVVEGGGSIAGSGTDETGTSTATWTLGPTVGEGTARATAGSADVTFTSTALVNGVIQGTVTEQAAFLSPARLASAVAASLAPSAGAPLASTSRGGSAAAWRLEGPGAEGRGAKGLLDLGLATRTTSASTAMAPPRRTVRR